MYNYEKVYSLKTTNVTGCRSSSKSWLVLDSIPIVHILIIIIEVLFLEGVPGVSA